MIAYRPEIDGLRAIAVLSAILFHAGIETFSGGFVGVEVFFVISGYLITSIILGDFDKGRFSLANFYERRARRILPALFFISLITMPVAYWIMLPAEIIDYAESLVASTFFSSNILFWRGESYFSPISELKPLLHTWTLAVEEQYYIFFPLIVMAFHRYGRNAIKIIVYLGIMSSFALTIFALNNKSISSEAVFYLLPTRAWEILAGSATAIALRRHDIPKNDTASFLGLVMIVIPIFLYDGNIPYPSQYTLMPVIGTVLIVLFAGKQGMVTAFLSMPVMVGIGLISYSAYLWHQPILAFIRLSPKTSHHPHLILLAILATFLLAFLSYKYVETPFRKKENGFVNNKQFTIIMVLLASSFVAFWIAAKNTDGFVGRYPPHDRELATLSFEEEAKYVVQHFDPLNLAPFDNNKANKILIIGDSYAKDFLNSVIEEGRHKNSSISTFHILVACGNLDIDPTSLQQNINAKDRADCIGQTRYENETLQQRLKEANYVILASSWRDWQARLLPQSLANIAERTDAEIIVLGRKSFGEIDIKRYLSMNTSERVSTRNTLGSDHVLMNNYMIETIDGSFVNFQQLVCNHERTCPVFTSSGDLISFDGAHLTPEGAKYAGEKLFKGSLLLNKVFPQTIGQQ